MSEEASPYLTTPELAKRLRRKPQTIRMWRYRGQGPRGRKVGGAVLYLLDDVIAWEKKEISRDAIGRRCTA